MSALWTPPPLGVLADEHDELGWERDLHGRMLDEATPDDAVITEGWTDEDDDRLRSYALGLDPAVLGGFKLDLPSALRAFGLVVEVVPGWEKRGSSSFNPGGVVGHHTAGAATGIRPSLRICIHGRSDLPGPLCQVFLDRNGVAVVVAAGRANHAGRGGFRGLVGNSAVYGIEAESKGTEPNAWTPQQLEAYPKVTAALLSTVNRDESWYCRHATWAGPRKPDTVSLTDQWMRDRSGLLLRPPAPTPENQEIDMAQLPVLQPGNKTPNFHVQLMQKALECHTHDLSQEGGADGMFGPGTANELNQFKAARGMPADSRVDTLCWEWLLGARR